MLYWIWGTLHRNWSFPIRISSDLILNGKILNSTFARNKQYINTTQKNEVFHFSTKCDQIRRKLRIWSHLLKKSLMENFIFYTVQTIRFRLNMSDKQSFSDKDVLMSNLSNEVPSYATFDKAVVETNENQNSFKDSKPSWDLHQVITARTKIQVFFTFIQVYKYS